MDLIQNNLQCVTYSKFGSFALDIKEYFIYDVTLDFKDMVQQQKWTANLLLVCIAFGSTERGEDD